MAETIKATPGDGIETTINTKTTTPGKKPASKENMSERRNVSFWDAANVRLTVVNSIVVGIVAISMSYTSQLLFNQAVSAEVKTLQKDFNDRKSSTDENFSDIKTTLKNDVVSPTILKLQLDPIVELLKKQSAILDDIRFRQAGRTPPPANPDYNPPP